MESKFRAFKFKYAYDLVTTVYIEVCISLNYFFEEFFYRQDNEILFKMAKPHKETLLHDYIEMVWKFGNSHCRKVVDFKNIFSRYSEILQTYEIDYPEKKYSMNNDQYLDLLESLMEPANKKISDEAFNILFNNRVFLLEFNRRIQKNVLTLKKVDFPQILAKDGVIKRHNYFNKWLKDGLFFRDKGLCQICGKDLTCTIRLGEELHYDHIIPLAKGGTNDPTNMQLLCSVCNLNKSSVKIETSDICQAYW